MSNLKNQQTKRSHLWGSQDVCAGNSEEWLKYLCRRWKSLLLKQGGDVDVPADGLSVEATGEQVAQRVVFTPGRAAHHPSVTLTHTHTLQWLYLQIFSSQKEGKPVTWHGHVTKRITHQKKTNKIQPQCHIWASTRRWQNCRAAKVATSRWSKMFLYFL